jgi:hypothetical protein
MRRAPKMQRAPQMRRGHVHGSTVVPIGNIPIPNPFEGDAKGIGNFDPNGYLPGYFQQLSSAVYFVRGLSRLLTFFASSLVLFCATTNFNNVDKTFETVDDATLARTFELNTTWFIAIFQRSLELLAVLVLMFESIAQTKTPFGEALGPTYSWLNIFRIPYYFLLAMLYFQAAAIDLGDGTQALIDLGLDDNFEDFRPDNASNPPSLTSDLGIGRLMYNARIVLVTFGSVCLAVEMVHILVFAPLLRSLTKRFVSFFGEDYEQMLTALGSDIFQNPYSQLKVNEDSWAWTIERHYEDIDESDLGEEGIYDPNANLRILNLLVWLAMAMTGFGYELYYLIKGASNFEFTTEKVYDLFNSTKLPPTSAQLTSADVGSFSLSDFVLTSLCTMGIVAPTAIKFTYYFVTTILSKFGLRALAQPHRVNSIEAIACIWSLLHAVTKAEAFFKSLGIFDKTSVSNDIGAADVFDDLGLEGTAAQTNVCILTWAFLTLLVLTYALDLLSEVYLFKGCLEPLTGKRGPCMGGTTAVFRDALDLLKFGVLNATSFLSPIASALIGGLVSYLLIVFGAFKSQESEIFYLINISIGVVVYLILGNPFYHEDYFPVQGILRSYLKRSFGGSADIGLNLVNATLTFKAWRFLYPLAIVLGAYSVVYFVMAFGANIIEMHFTVKGKIADISEAIEYLTTLADAVITMVGTVAGVLNPCMNKIDLGNSNTAVGALSNTGEVGVGNLRSEEYDPWTGVFGESDDVLQSRFKYSYCFTNRNRNIVEDTGDLWQAEIEMSADDGLNQCVKDYQHDNGETLERNTDIFWGTTSPLANVNDNPDGLQGTANYCWTRVASSVSCNGPGNDEDDNRMCRKAGYGKDSTCRNNKCTYPEPNWKPFNSLSNEYPPKNEDAGGSPCDNTENSDSDMCLTLRDDNGAVQAYDYNTAKQRLDKALNLVSGTRNDGKPQTCRDVWYDYQNRKISNLLNARSRLRAARASDNDCFDRGGTTSKTCSGTFEKHKGGPGGYCKANEKCDEPTFNLNDYGGSNENIDADSLVTYNEECLRTTCIAVGATIITAYAVEIGGQAACSALDAIPYFPGGVCATIVSAVTKAISMAAKAARMLFKYGKTLARSIAGLFRKRKAIKTVADAVKSLVGSKPSTLKMPNSMMTNFAPALLIVLFSLFIGFWRREATQNPRISWLFALGFFALLVCLLIIFVMLFGVGGGFKELQQGTLGANITSTYIEEQAKLDCNVDSELFFGYSNGIFICSLRRILDLFNGVKDKDGNPMFETSATWGAAATYLRRCLFMQMLASSILFVFFLLDAISETLGELPYIGFLFREDDELLPDEIRNAENSSSQSRVDEGPSPGALVVGARMSTRRHRHDNQHETTLLLSEFEQGRAPVLGEEFEKQQRRHQHGRAIPPETIGAEADLAPVEETGTTLGGWLIAWIFVVPVLTNAVRAYGVEESSFMSKYFAVGEPQRLYSFFAFNSDLANEAMGDLAESGIFGAHNTNAVQVFGSAGCDITPTGLIFKKLLKPIMNAIPIDGIKIPIPSVSMPEIDFGNIDIHIQLRTFDGIKRLWADMFDNLDDLAGEFREWMGTLSELNPFGAINLMAKPELKFEQWEFAVIWFLPLLFCGLVILGTVLALVLPDNRKSNKDRVGNFKVAALTLIRSALIPLAFMSLQQIVAVMSMMTMLQGLDAILFKFEVTYGESANSVYISSMYCVCAALALNFNAYWPVNG